MENQRNLGLASWGFQNCNSLIEISLKINGIWTVPFHVFLECCLCFFRVLFLVVFGRFSIKSNKTYVCFVSGAQICFLLPRLFPFSPRRISLSGIFSFYEEHLQFIRNIFPFPTSFLLFGICSPWYCRCIRNNLSFIRNMFLF